MKHGLSALADVLTPPAGGRGPARSRRSAKPARSKAKSSPRSTREKPAPRVTPIDPAFRWRRNASDDKAIANGCTFDELRGSYAVWWIERYCRLYEGSDGDPLLLRGCHDCAPPPHVLDDWFLDDGETPDPYVTAIFLERAARHCECIAAGHHVDWQYETVMRAFGWVRYSEQWKRLIRRFREISVTIAKKNKKSPTLVAIAMHMFAGDGEFGQHVFFAAKDGTQARKIAGTHAIEMVRQSPELAHDCSINKVEYQITHNPTRSTILPLSSSNANTQSSKEGLNGSTFTDETHVVDRAFMSRISRAGISRAEPFHAEFSTAGNNPDGYGKERFDHACKVISGEVEDEALLAIVYAAPQDLTPEELSKDPLKYGRMANPAMGHTVNPEEYLADYRRSLRSPEALAEFMMYRLNVWMHASAPWLDPFAWRRCAHAAGCSSDRLAGRRCWGGLDLARVYDMSALAWIFPPVVGEEVDEPFRLKVQFWMPRDTAIKRAALAPYQSWSDSGALTLTDGNWTDDEPIMASIQEANKLYQVEGLTYDEKYADGLIKMLLKQGGWSEGQFSTFSQTAASYTGPTSEFERLLVAGLLAHEDNPVLNWQAGHVVLVPSRDKTKKPIKPKRGGHQTVDGIQAAIMALGLYMEGASAPRPSYYDDHELEMG